MKQKEEEVNEMSRETDIGCLAVFTTRLCSACDVLNEEFMKTASKVFDEDTMKRLNDARNVIIDIAEKHHEMMNKMLEEKE